MKRRIIMNNLDKRQNEEKMLMLQYSARCNFNRAEVMYDLSWLLPILNIVLANIPTIKSHLGNGLVIISTIITVAVIVLKTFVNKFTMIAAGTRQLFDYELFNFGKPSAFAGINENDISAKASEERQRNNKKYQNQIRYTGRDKEHGVKDWYRIDPSWDEKTAIYKCQQQNPVFDKKLSLIIIAAFYAILALCIIIVIVLNLNTTVHDLILSGCSIIPLLTKIVETLCNIHKLNQIIGIEDERLSSLDSNLIRAQEKIDERRRFAFIIPNFLYEIMSDKLHNTVDDVFMK